MKSFFSSLLASIIGCAIVLGTCVLILIIVMGALMSFDTSETYTVKKNSVLHLNLAGVMTDRVEKNPLAEFFGENATPKIALSDVLSSIELAKTDNNISGIYIKAGILSASSASLTEIRNALKGFKEDTDKFVVAYGDIYTQGAYYLSTVADKVIINPEGSLDIHGFSVSPMFYKGLLDKVGVKMQIFKVGTFKSAVEPYINNEMSVANKEQVSSYINDMWATTSNGIAEARNIDIKKVNEIADYAPALRETKYALENKLVDDLMYESEVHKHLKDLMGVAHDKKISLVTPENMVSAYPETAVSDKNDVVAILYAEGTINSGSSRDGITDGRLIRELKNLEENKNVKAVVLRVNSPGGSAYASEQIWKAVADLKKANKPVVVSMGDVAASGGYYISCNADRIVASPTTITGSIGIFGLFPNVSKTLSKLGISSDVVKTNELSDFGNISRGFNDKESELLQSYIDKGYDLFLTRCADGRGMQKDSLAKYAEGRVWTGKQAKEIGLVDELGGVEDAIRIAADLANLGKSYAVYEYPKMKNKFEELLNKNKEELVTKAAKEWLGDNVDLFLMLKNQNEQEFIQARIPYELNIK